MSKGKHFYKPDNRNILMSFLIFLVIFGFSMKVNQYVHQKDQLSQLTEHALLLADSYTESSSKVNPDEFLYLCQFNDSTFNTKVVILDDSSKILSDHYGIFSLEDWNEISVIEDPVIDTALEGKIGTSKKAFTKYLEKSVFAVAVPVYSNNEINGVLINISTSTTNPESYPVVLFMSILTLVGIYILMTISYNSYTKKSKKIVEDFTRVTKELSNGNFEARVSSKYLISPEYSDIVKNINQMAGELSNLEEMRRDFIANISHDFRSPLTSIRGFVQAMLDGTIPKDNQDKYLNIVLDESDRLTNLTNDLLMLSLIQSNNYPVEKINFDVHEVIRKVVMQFEQKLLQKNIILNLRLPGNELLVLADLNQIYRVLYNIIDNAIKFSYEAGEISIETFTVDSKANIIINDKGEGISEDSLKHIWDRFYKYDKSRGKDRKGVGLGLSIVQEIIRAHNEKIHVFSEPQKGTTFVFTLSIAEK